MGELTLGLDIGANSIGWALIDEDLGAISAMGVRVFPEGVERDTKGGELSKNEQRRMARAMRRQIARRARRKWQLRKELVAAGLLPELALLPNSDPERVQWESQQFQAADPYILRQHAAAGKKLRPWEVGRVLLHLNQRRGFLSNSKADRGEKKEDSEILKEIGELGQALSGRTLGQYLNDLRGTDPKSFHLTRLRGKHTHRSMFEAEFAAMWAAQQPHHPGILTDELRDRLVRIIFFQRNLRPPSASVVGRCELNPRLPRCPRADRRAQKFRMFQEVNNLRVIDLAAQHERCLQPEERDLLIKYLSAAKERTFDQIRKQLFDQYESYRFNLERGGRTKLHGLPTDAFMSQKAMLGRAWQKLPEGVKDRIVAAVIDADEKQLAELLRESGMEERVSAQLIERADFEAAYSSYSLHAIKRLLPHVELGLPLTSRDAETPCALREAGFLMPWEHQPGKRPFLPDPPNVTNPLVRQALHEVRKVINSVLRELVYKAGHSLRRISLELAREVRGSAKQRADRIREMRERETKRSSAAAWLRDRGRHVTRAAIERYLLWQEQGEVCPYSGRPISPEQLFDGETNIDHILPRPRSLDDSGMNKVLCFRFENAAKGDRTPFEWVGGDPSRYEEILQRAKKLPYPKLKRFYQKTVELDDFFARQFVDTTYITTQVFDYVRCLGAQVLCPKGQHTAELRHLWGLDTLLRDIEDSPAWKAASELPTGEKNRLDHRHHAVDALVIALTSQKTLQRLARAHRSGGDAQQVEDEFDPWERFREGVVNAVMAINVSHRVRRKVSGAIHEETIYGPTERPGELVVRKDLTALTCSMIPDIRDRAVRERVIERLKQFKIEPGRGKDKIPVEVWRERLWMNQEKGVQIRKVRLIRREKTVEAIRGGTAFVKPGSNHHLCLFRRCGANGKTEVDARFVTMLEAMDRVRRHAPIIQRQDQENQTFEFWLSLSANEMVLLEHEGKEVLCRFEKAASTSKQMWFRHHTAGGKSGEKIGVISKKPATFSGRKVTVNPIGQIRWAND